MKVAIFGGTFSPPHRGHIQIVESLIESKLFDFIWVQPAYGNRFKICSATFQERFEMSIIAFENIHPMVRISAFEQKFKCHTTFDLMKRMKKIMPNDDFYYVIGSDCANELYKWHNIHELKEMVKFVVVNRYSDMLDVAIDPPHFLLETSDIAYCSSSMLRDEFHKNPLGITTHQIAFLTKPVIDYIKTNNLYTGSSF